MLTYAVTPRQLPAGSGPAKLEVSVRNESGADVACRAIRFAFPVEQLGAGIAVAADTATWTVVPSKAAPGAFDATPVAPATGIGTGQAVGFVFSGVRPAAAPGPATIHVREATGAGPGEQDLTVELVGRRLSITAFTASRLFVAPGAAVTFAWETLDADGVKLDWGEGSHDGGPSGSWTVNPRASISATLTAYKGGGTSTAAQLAITVRTPQILSAGTDPDPAVVALGGPVQLAWETLYAERCTLFSTASGRQLPVPTVAEAFPVAPERSGSYELHAIGAGRTVPVSFDVVVEPVAAHFSATPVIAPGGAATLAWAAEWATGVTIDPDPGIGELPLAGSVEVHPAEETTYTLTAAGLEPKTLTARVAMYPAVTLAALEVWLVHEPGAQAGGLALAYSCRGAASATAGGVAVNPGGGTLRRNLLPGQAVAYPLVFTSGAGAVAACRLAVETAGGGGDWAEGLELRLGGDARHVLNVPGGSCRLAWDQASIGVGPTVWTGEVTTPGAGTQEQSGTAAQIEFAVGAAPDPEGRLWHGSVRDGQPSPRIAVSCSVAANVPPTAGG